jgi:hypothetical protein
MFIQGIEFLVAIGKGADACRYLQSCDRWRDAAWLAKVALPAHESAVILRRWADDLIDHEAYSEAIPILLSLGCFHQVLQVCMHHRTPTYRRGAQAVVLTRSVVVLCDQLLYQSQRHHLAYHFLEAANEVNVLGDTEATDAEQPLRLTITKELLSVQSLHHSIHVVCSQ